MESQNDTPNAEVPATETVKKKMGRPRIHPIKPAKDKKLSLYWRTVRHTLDSITARTLKQYLYALLVSPSLAVKVATPYTLDVIRTVLY